MRRIATIAHGLRMTARVGRAVYAARVLAKEIDTTAIWAQAWRPHTHGMGKPGTVRAWAGVMKRAFLNPLPPIPDCPVIVCAETQTEVAAVEGVVEELGKRGVGWCTWGTDPAPPNTAFFVGKAARERIRQSILIWIILTARSPQNRGEAYEDSVYTAAEALLALSGQRARALLLSNTHSTFPAHAAAAARALGLATIYVQHAPTHRLLPPLEVDVACLDGQVAFEAYRSIAAREGNTHRPVMILTGKRDLPGPTQGNDTGVAFNSLDDPHRVAAFLHNEPAHKGALVFRPHPSLDAMELAPWRALATQIGANWSDPARESAWKYTERLHTLYAGATGLVLQAAFAGVACKQWINPSIDDGDHYAFQQWGVCAGPDQPARKAETKALAQWSSTYGMAVAGQESAWVATLVAQMIAQGKTDPSLLGFQAQDHGDGWIVWTPSTPSNHQTGNTNDQT